MWDRCAQPWASRAGAGCAVVRAWHRGTEGAAQCELTGAAPLALAPPVPPSLPPFQRLVHVLGVEPAKIHEALCKQKVELVFTAHPTQASGGGEGGGGDGGGGGGSRDGGVGCQWCWAFGVC